MSETIIYAEPGGRWRRGAAVARSDGTIMPHVTTLGDAVSRPITLFATDTVIAANTARASGWIDLRWSQGRQDNLFSAANLMIRATAGGASVFVEESDDGVTARQAEDGGPWSLTTTARLTSPDVSLRAAFVRVRVLAGTTGVTLGQNSLLLLR